MGDYDGKPWLKSYDEGVSPELDIPDEPVTAGYERVRKQFPDRPAFHFFGVTWTYGELFDARPGKRGNLDPLSMPFG